ncbi:isochorismatase [Fadolivirus algeromassiliense]|jgi:nicotinamidase/pyrazinamidase|uniref:nicotinamidase n=1 Tax=Fadolivirus FV1/VV64 TaxID=3070911 RepID=A0A7D3V5W1_9VIRU|nr:isochorismatase [Fadolivirus algeromassiliense]QKF94392.1 isochorismatase [Fadolivirus FV1/VV64]
MESINALVIIDMQYDLCNGGPLAFERSLNIIPIINRIRDEYDHIIFVKRSYPDNHSTFKQYGGKHPKHCVNGTDGEKIHNDIIMSINDTIIARGNLQKYGSSSAFYDAEDIERETRLKPILKINNIKKLYFCGNDFENTIFSTIMDAIKFNYKCCVIKDAITYNDKEKMEKTIEYLKKLNVEII